jgi:Tfp pilus assembly protein PilO
MSLTARDRKIAIAIVPLLLVVAYWFLLLSPKREEATAAKTELGKQQQRLTQAQGKVDQASTSKATFASDYTTVVKLGKAIPATKDMPGLLVQLDRASHGTGIRFTKIATGEAEGGAAPTPPPSSAPESQPPAAAGGTPAQSAPGSSAEQANNASAQSDQANQAAQSSGVEGADTQTSTPAGGAGAAPAAAGTTPPGLETVPLQLEFEGNFFNLADFFHRVKRLVRTYNDKVVVSGRLLTIEKVHYTSDPEAFPKLTAELDATIYLVPTAQGTSAGATPQGPSEATPASAGGEATPQGAPTPPAATATPR